MIKIGITQGDINGIGYEVIIKTFMDIRVLEMCTPIVYGSAKVAAYHRKALNIENFSFNNIKSAGEANNKRANIISMPDDHLKVELGKITDLAGEASLTALEMAVRDIKNKKIDAIVTAPIHKFNIRSEKFQHPGHTEYFMSEFGTEDVLMFMINDFIRVGVVTGHVALADVPKHVTVNNILSKLRIMGHSLLADFGIRKPRIAVLGLNPHAGDNGIIGTEDRDIVEPAINKAKDEGILAFGPYPADGFFGSGAYKKFDAVLAMYHDQGLIAFKTIGFEEGVNYTAGLPIIRTSPAHGTAFDIAGKNEASEASFRHAVYMACDIYKNRKMYHEISKDPLKTFDLSTLE